MTTTLTSTQQTTIAAIIHAPDGVRFFAMAHSARALATQIVEYISERCDYVLWPAAARQVRALIAHGDADAAIATYFANVGLRWDEEWLEVDTRVRVTY
jgi:hypothetical protein